MNDRDGRAPSVSPLHALSAALRNGVQSIGSDSPCIFVFVYSMLEKYDARKKRVFNDKAIWSFKSVFQLARTNTNYSNWLKLFSFHYSF